MREKDISTILNVLAQSKRILFLTGAGISQESGIPTYRDRDGIYRQKSDLEIEEILNPETLASQPHLVWNYIYDIEKNCRNARPNEAHLIIAEMEKCFPFVLTVTQNVDGLHRKAGSKNLIELHGYIYELVCMKCGDKFEVNDFSEIEIPPQCAKCGGILRPDVVLFGESLPPEKYFQFRHEVEKGFDILFVIGTTAIFPYIKLPVYEIKRKNGLVVEINPSYSEISPLADIKITEKAVPALTEIWERFKGGLK